MRNLIVRNWWAVALRGLLAVAFGIMTLSWPGITLVSLIMVFAAYAFLDGIFALITAVRHREQRSVALAVEGVAGIAAGTVAVLLPGITAMVLLYLIAIWAVVTGVFELIAAVKLRKTIEGELFLGLAGILSIAFGVLLMVRPGLGALAVVWLIGAYALAFGVMMLALGFRVRVLDRRSSSGQIPSDRAPRLASPSPGSSGLSEASSSAAVP